MFGFYLVWCVLVHLSAALDSETSLSRLRLKGRDLSSLPSELHIKIVHHLEPLASVAKFRQVDRRCDWLIQQEPTLSYWRLLLRHQYRCRSAADQCRFVATHPHFAANFLLTVVVDASLTAEMLLAHDANCVKHDIHYGLSGIHDGLVDSLRSLQRLHRLDLSDVVERFHRLTLPEHLHTLIVTGVHIAALTLPSALHTLEVFDLSEGQLPSLCLPLHLHTLQLHNLSSDRLDGLLMPDSLRVLDLKRSSLTTLAHFSFPPHLRHIDLPATQIASLRGSLLPAYLHTLILAGSPLKELYGADLPPHLHTLELQGSALTAIFGDLPEYLHTLDLSFTPINTRFTLPPRLVRLVWVESKIKSLIGVALPYSLCDMIFYRAADMHAFDHIALPPKLRRLDLSYSAVASMEGTKISPLTHIVLKGTPLSRKKPALTLAEREMIQRFFDICDEFMHPRRI